MHSRGAVLLSAAVLVTVTVVAGGTMVATTSDDTTASQTCASPSAGDGAAQDAVDCLDPEGGETPSDTPSVSVSLTPTPEPPAKKLLGMSAPDEQWSQRLAEVGPKGIRARRIFGQLTATGDDRGSVIDAAHAAGMTPVVSYKVPSVPDAIAGAYDDWAVSAARYLQSFGKPTYVAVWHEPRGDMTRAQYIGLQERLVPLLKRNCEVCEVGPILNGFLLTGSDAQRDEWARWTTDALLRQWDYLGLDVYQSGTPERPGPITPGDRMAPLLAFLEAEGVPDMPVVVGEYNGFSAKVITDSVATFLDTPNLVMALLFNSSNGDKGVVLSGEMLAAFRAAKADPRVLK